ncbi:hypothetical protein NP233_g3648 [Leucocoprinus birnbaumii]|uniref:DNA (cytosine-5-)-methyltransferase n=1 Tax=Leucocoprinus birnbaumii TaxID=56174 RepID=A0AAD5YXU7_9AGAR|nr:hypothetical protein NP233_g3648 [Leucocoprinus birnbaumii]
MPPRRPNAFEVSFPEEVHREAALRKKREEDERERRRHAELLAAQQVDQKKLKRKERENSKKQEKERRKGADPLGSTEEDVDIGGIEHEFMRPSKKVQLDLPTEYYFAKPDETRETADTYLEGEEDHSDNDEGSDGEDSDTVRARSRSIRDNGPQPPRKDRPKPIRILTDFTIFDTRHRNELVIFSKIEDEDGVDRRFEVAGLVVPYYVDEEDLVGEDGDEGGNGRGVEEVEPIYMRVGPVLGYSIDWTKDKDPFYIETPHAWYILKMPAKNYSPWYQMFYTPRRLAQLVIASAMKQKRLHFNDFVHDTLNNTVGIFGDRFVEDDLWDAADLICDIIAELQTEQPDKNIRVIPVIAHILKHASRTPTDSRQPHRRKKRLDGPSRLRITAGLLIDLRNPDLAVLKQENQNPTHVTPLIASLARGFINEELIVIGPPPPKERSQAENAMRAKAQLGILWKLIERARGGILGVDWKKEDRVTPRSNYLRKVEVGGVVYKPGDFVLVPRGKYGSKDLTLTWPRQFAHLPQDASIASYFWFARIIYIKNEEQIAHVQWLEHASQTMLNELANSQELFFCKLCNPIPLGCLVAKAQVHVNPAGSVKPDEYFVRYIHDLSLATFVAVPQDYHRCLDHYNDASNRASATAILDYCPICIAVEEDNHKMQWQYEPLPPRRERNGLDAPEARGIVFNGKVYHLFDFVLHRADKGPSHIGQIVDFVKPRHGSRTSLTLRVRKVGRIWDLVGLVNAVEGEIKDERHAFLTEEEAVIPYTDIIDKAVVLSRESFGQRISLRKWLDTSPRHFYVRFRFKKMIPEPWDTKSRVSFRDIDVCKKCTEETIAHYYDVNEFKNKMQNSPMRVMDLFGGVGAFSLGLKEGSGCLKVTHALEISPSAARTIKRNCPDTEVINQCVNTVLRYEIKKNEGHHIERPSQLWSPEVKIPIPELPAPGEVDIITAGFPCQTHSRLNMFKTANDIKSNLMLTALSWVDHYRPKYVYMENVTGFLSFHLNTKQAGLHRVEGGVTMGGLKLLIRLLLEMGYQVRYSLLQAGHYGTPQRRVRFFLIAAKGDLPLPDLPQPTHDFPQTNRLAMTMPNGDIIRPIRTNVGTAPHPFVSIEDAIGDLPKFDWKRPGQVRRNGRDEREREGVPVVVCDYKKPHCGYQGRVEYQFEPKTSYQRDARVKESNDLQHYTKTVKARKVDRVVAIPLRPGADYRSLRADMYEWQFANPISSAARSNFRPDKDSCFPTIVTNIDPMAKQSKVLHPYCKRIVTVRELARAQGFPDWFVFETHRGNVTTIHKQIGNAVPLPLARALGRELGEVLLKEWKEGRLEGVVGWEGEGHEGGGNEIELVDDEHDSDDEMEIGSVDGRDRGGFRHRPDHDEEMQDLDWDRGRDSDEDSMEGLYT